MKKLDAPINFLLKKQRQHLSLVWLVVFISRVSDQVIWNLASETRALDNNNKYWFYGKKHKQQFDKSSALQQSESLTYLIRAALFSAVCFDLSEEAWRFLPHLPKM